MSLSPRVPTPRLTSTNTVYHRGVSTDGLSRCPPVGSAGLQGSPQWRGWPLSAADVLAYHHDADREPGLWRPSHADGMISLMVDRFLELTLAGAPHQLAAAEIEGIPSRLSGRVVRRLEVRFSLSVEALNDAVVRELMAAGKEDMALVEKDSQRRWLVEQNSYSHSGGAEYTHTAVLRELENLTASAVELPGIRLVPEKYAEEDSGQGPYNIRFMTTVEGPDEDLLEQFFSEHRQVSYFPVVRVGVRDQPVSMRLGRCLWQSLPGGRRHLITLVSEEGDSSEVQHALRGVLTLNQPAVRRLEDAAVGVDSQLRALLTELVNAGTLDPAAVDRVIRAGEPNALDQGKAARRFEQADNLDDFW
jgi:hypothetical protein